MTTAVTDRNLTRLPRNQTRKVGTLVTTLWQDD
jgi:hypothetical protein